MILQWVLSWQTNVLQTYIYVYMYIYIYVCVCTYACYHENNVPSVMTTVALMYGYTLLVPINHKMLYIYIHIYIYIYIYQVIIGISGIGTSNV